MARGQLDVATLRLELERLRELLDLDIARPRYQPHRAHHVARAELAQVHADPAGHGLRAQLGIAGAFELQRLGQVLEIQRPGERAANRHLTGDVLQIHIGTLAYQVDPALDVERADQFAAADIQPCIAAQPG